MKVYPIGAALIALMTFASAAVAQDAPPPMQQDTPSPSPLQGSGSPLGDAPTRGSPPSSASEDGALPSAGPTAAERASPGDESRGATGEAGGESGKLKENGEADGQARDSDAAKMQEPGRASRAGKEARDEDGPARDRSATKESEPTKTEDADDARPGEKRQARETETREGDQGKAKSVQLTGEKRDRVRQAFGGARHARQSKDVDIDISIGQRLPATWDLYPVPAVVVELVPEYSGYVYAYVGDEYVICDPDTYAVVAVIDAGPGKQAAGGDIRCSSGLTLSATEEDVVLDAVRDTEEEDVGAIRVGWDVPDSIELHRFDDRVTARAPELDACRYFVAEDQVAIVDPQEEEVVLLVKD